MTEQRQAIRVMIVDDSTVARRILSDALSTDPRIDVAWTATDGIDCLEQLKTVKPDVITLDVQMPNLDGLATLREIIRLHCIPVLMVSSMTQKDAAVTVEALHTGAVDFVSKPSADSAPDLMAIADEVADKVVEAASVNVQRFQYIARVALAGNMPRKVRRRLVCLGASTGGPRTLQSILAAFPGDFPCAFLVAQHMPSGFTKELASRLNATCQLSVSEAKDGDLVTPGRVYVAPGGPRTMTIEKDPLDESATIRIRPKDDPTPYAPSIDALFRSAGEQYGATCMGILLTGMGTDGCEGLGVIQAAGGFTLAESKDSCVIYGMPCRAVEKGVVDMEAPKEAIARHVLEHLM